MRILKFKTCYFTKYLQSNSGKNFFSINKVIRSLFIKHDPVQKSKQKLIDNRYFLLTKSLFFRVIAKQELLKYFEVYNFKKKQNKKKREQKLNKKLIPVIKITKNEVHPIFKFELSKKNINSQVLVVMPPNIFPEQQQQKPLVQTILQLK